MTLPTSKIKERGFTIVELLIVIIVIGILAALVLVAYSNVQAQARDVKRQGNAASVRDAMASYKAASTTGYYPQSSTPALFQSDITTGSNYSGGQAVVNVDSTVSALITNTLANVSGSPAANMENIYVGYCPTPGTSTYANGTGVKIVYWSETGAAQKTIFTGTTC